MAKISSDPSQESKSLDDRVADMMTSVVVTTKPVVVCGVQRKANIGNFENVDIYCAVALPTELEADIDTQALIEALGKQAELGFHVASTETLTRYRIVKNAAEQNNKG